MVVDCSFSDNFGLKKARRLNDLFVFIYSYQLCVNTEVVDPRRPIWAYWILRYRSISFNDMGPILDGKHLGQYRSTIQIDIGHRHCSISIIVIAQYRSLTLWR